MADDEARTSLPPSYPDPTVLTTEALRRDLQALKDLLHAEMNGDRDLHLERFNRLQRELEQVERTRVEQKKDAEESIASALTAQKEAVAEQTKASQLSIGKSETATLKSLDQLASTFTEAVGGIRREIDDLKDLVVRTNSRIDTGQGTIVGGRTNHSDQLANSNFTVTVILAVVAGAGVLCAIGVAVLK